MSEEKNYREESLERIIKDIFWMARRYAHGRHTYAPGIIRDAYHKLKAYGVEIESDKTLEAPKEEDCKGFVFRSDYLDDIN